MFKNFNLAGLLMTALLTATGGAMAAIGTGKFNPVAVGAGALTGLVAGAVGYVQNPTAPAPKEQVAAEVAAAAQVAVNQEINRIVPGMFAAVARHAADSAINALASQAAGVKINAQPSGPLPPAPPAPVVETTRAVVSAPRPNASAPAPPVPWPTPAPAPPAPKPAPHVVDLVPTPAELAMIAQARQQQQQDNSNDIAAPPPVGAGGY